MGGRRGVVRQWKCLRIVSTSVYVLGGVRDGVGRIWIPFDDRCVPRCLPALGCVHLGFLIYLVWHDTADLGSLVFGAV